ncbi:nitric oxide reductase transcriptional regulator NorR [Halomonas sp. WWR20]
MTSFLLTLQDLLARLNAGQPAEALRVPWTRLLEALIGGYPADASMLMVANDDGLHPVAALGLPKDVWGRCFTLQAHPRLAAIAQQSGVCRFTPDCALPDPFDGLIDEYLTQVHDCMGVALRDGDRLIGILILGALECDQLNGLKEHELHAAASLLATCLCLATQLSMTRSRLSEALTAQHPSPAPSQWYSPAMRRLSAALDLVSPTDMSVLLHGETGVGKERVARQLHALSTRHQGPLVQVNCAALPEHLIESELFGHHRGAFSGAIKDHRGHFAMADGGTLMLDEIGELPLALQPKLLRVLQEGEIQPLGSERPQRVDVRIVAVTNRDLAAEVAAGRFREDLFHRLSAFPLQVPPLRERREDILLLAGSFLEENRIRLGLANLRLAAEAEAALLAWHWPGNVRELEHTLSRAALRALGETLQERPAPPSQHRHWITARITCDHLDLPQEASRGCEDSAASTIASPLKEKHDWRALRQATDDFQRQYIHHALASHGDNWAATARVLATDSGNLHRLAKRLGLK